MAKYEGPIVITGLGAVSPFGLGVEAVWSALQQGERVATALESEEAEAGAQPVWTMPVGELPFADLLGKRGLKYLRPSTQFLLAASVLAMREAALADEQTDPDSLGITVGSNLAGLHSMANYDYTAITEGPHYVSPMDAPNTLANAPASHLAIRLKARALNTTIASGQCAGLDALGYAAKAIREGRARQIVAAGVEETSSAAIWVYRHSQVLSSGYQENAGRPFDAESNGWLVSEGAAVMVLERKADAQARGARSLAELAGWSSAFSPGQDLEKRARVLRRTAQQALDAAGIAAEAVDVVIASANGAQVQDQVEVQALRGLLAENTKVSVVPVKGTLGESYGASGLFQALAAVCMLDRGLIPASVSGKQQRLSAPVNGLLTETRTWPESKQGTTLLLAQDLFGSTSAVVLRGSQE